MNDWNDLANKTFLVGLLANYLDPSATDTDCVTQEGWDQLQAMIDGRSKEWLNAETQKNVCATGDYINNIAATQISLDYASDGMDKAAWYRATGKCAGSPPRQWRRNSPCTRSRSRFRPALSHLSRSKRRCWQESRYESVPAA